MNRRRINCDKQNEKPKRADSAQTLCSSAVEGLPGWETRLYLIEYPPGADGSRHRHPVVGLGYMLSGT